MIRKEGPWCVCYLTVDTKSLWVVSIDASTLRSGFAWGITRLPLLHSGFYLPPLLVSERSAQKKKGGTLARRFSQWSACFVAVSLW